MKSIDEYIFEIERHRGIFDPSKKYYLEVVFRFSCQYLERQGHKPSENFDKLDFQMRYRLKETRDMVVDNYWKINKECIIYCPDFKSIPTLVDYDLSKIRKLLEDSK